jgi:hypothetical protein
VTELSIRIAWAAIAVIHLSPAAVVLAPRLLPRLYGVEPNGDLGVLMTHRGALFAAVVAISVLAIFDPTARRAASLAAGISMVGFLVLYARAGFLPGPLRVIAWTDLAVLPALAWVALAAWRSGAPTPGT